MNNYDSYGSDFSAYGSDFSGGTILQSLFAFLWIYALIVLAISVFLTIVMWKIFKKAGQPGWAALIPVYNIIIMLKIAKMPMWWLALIFIPIVNYVGAIAYGIVWSLQIAKVFGKDTTFGVLTMFFSYVTLPILAFGDAKYVDDTSTNVATEPVQPMRPTVEPITPQPVQPTVAPVMTQPIQQNDLNNVESFMPEVEQPVQPTNPDNL